MTLAAATKDRRSDTVSAGRTLQDGVARYFEARDHLRRGICLLNAGCYEQAADLFTRAGRLNPDSLSLPHYVVRCLAAQGQYRAAADYLDQVLPREPDDLTAHIRHALLNWKAGNARAAVASLRASIAGHPDCAELHFQLGTLLAALQENDEAELRFTTALAIDARHVEAMVSLAMCFGAKQDPARAVALLQKAQSLRPGDARVGLLLTQAAQAARYHSAPVHNAPVLPPATDACDDERAREAVVQMFVEEPELVEAFLETSATPLDDELSHLLQETLHHAIQRSPQAADLHYRRGRVLKRVDKTAEAITSVEHAVRLDAGHRPARIELAKLYRLARRPADALRCLQEVIQSGVEYADVYLLLGDVYRETGQTAQAREAYGRSLNINRDFAAAREALAALPA